MKKLSKNWNGRQAPAAVPVCATGNEPCGKTPYRRERHLASLIACWPEELKDTSAANTGKIVAALKKALRAERRRGRAGHWTYDLNRHISLVAALKAESARLASPTGRKNRDAVASVATTREMTERPIRTVSTGPDRLP